MLPFFGLVDVRNILPPHWHREIEEIIHSISRDAILKGGSSTSLESVDKVVSYRLVDGNDIETHLPWLTTLYRTDFRQIAEQFSNRRLVADTSTTSSINVNILPPGEDGYEWHVDSNPVTGLLFLSSHLHEEGGMLELRTAGDHLLSIEPLAGTFAVFDARLCPHRVSAPLKGPRISAPMNYFFAEQGRHRPDDLDSALYGEQA